LVCVRVRCDGMGFPGRISTPIPGIVVWGFLADSTLSFHGQTALPPPCPVSKKAVSKYLHPEERLQEGNAARSKPMYNNPFLLPCTPCPFRASDPALSHAVKSIFPQTSQRFEVRQFRMGGPQSRVDLMYPVYNLLGGAPQSPVTQHRKSETSLVLRM